ncbi:MAG: C25 family cysteine peptidase [Acidobacteriota bacterium]
MMKPTATAWIFLACLLLPLQLHAQITLQSEVITAGTYRLTFNSTGYPSRVDQSTGKNILSFTPASRPEDEHPYPVREIYIALPANAHPAARLVVLKQQALAVAAIANRPPAAAPRSSVKGFLWIGSFYCMHISVEPFWYDAASATVMELKEFAVEVDLPSQTAGIRSDAGAQTVPEFIENLRYGSQWKAPKAGYAASPSDAWIDYTQEYLKLGVAKDGIYRLTYADLIASGVPVGSVDPRSFKLFLKGKELPLYVSGEKNNAFDAGDYIEFLGRRNYGDPDYRSVAPYGTHYREYLNPYSDTTIYWLSWAGAFGKRVDTVLASSGTPSDTVRYYDELVHSEANYYWDFQTAGGDVRKNSPEILENETWNDGTMGVGKLPVSFSVANLYPGKPARAFVKYGDFSSNVDAKAHNLSLSINSNPTAYDSGFSDKYETRVLNANFTSASLVNGTNTVNLNSYPTLNTINVIIRDWYELEYPRFLRASSDSLSFSYRNPVAPKLSVIAVSGLSAAPISLYRFAWADSGIVKITNYQRNADTLRFTDTASSGRSYFLLAGSKAKAPIIFYKKKFANLRSGSHRADYIAITHSSFVPAVTSYLSFIQSTYRMATQLIDVQDIYDEFNYGFFAPEPIRDFLRSTHTAWQAPYPSYVFLVGKGTYDYYGNKTKYFGVPRTPNFVPSYGNPVSDTWFTIWDTTGALIPQMSIGRVPAKTVDEFQLYSSRHQKYVTKGFDDWNKRYIFFSGGNFTEPEQLTQTKAVNDQIISNYVVKPPVGGIIANFYKTANPISNFGPYSPAYVSDAIDQGGMFISYIGHSGTQTWDNSITDVSQLANVRDRNPLITDFGCSTGKFAEPDVFSFSELAVNNSKGQAIGYIGNSSLGFTTTAYSFPQVFYRKLLIDTAVSVGETHRLAKIDYAKQYGVSGVFGLFILTNTLIGDPIVTLPLPQKPNLSFGAASVVLQPQRVTEQTDSVQVTFGYNNLGRVEGDSVDIAIRDQYQGASAFSSTLRRRMPNYIDSITAVLPIKGKAGEHLFSVSLDPANRVSEIYENDNALSYPFIVASSTLRNLDIAALANQSAGTIRFLNPSARPAGSTFIIDVSENSAFSPSRSYQVPYDTFVTTFKLDTSLYGKRVWIRTKLDAAGAEGLIYSYIVGGSDNVLLADSTSFSAVAREGLGMNGSRMYLDTTKTVISAISGGFNDGNTAVISRNGQNFIPENTLRGFHVVIFDAATYGYKGYYLFDVQTGLTASTNFKTLLDTLKTGNLIAVAISNDVASNGAFFPASLKASLKQYGSRYIDNVGVADSWTMIGWKGAQPGTAPEKYAKRYSGHTITVDTTITIPNTQGSFETEPIGPVAAWKNAVIRAARSAGGSIDVKIVGIKSDNTTDTLKTQALADSTIDLSAVNAQRYPSIRVRGELKRAAGQESPSISAIAVNYDQLAELGTNYQTVKAFVMENGAPARALAEGDTVQQGEKVLLSYRIYNAGGVAAKKFSAQAAAVWSNNNIEPIGSVVIDSLAPKSFTEASALYNTSLGSGRRSIRIAVDPDTLVRELYKDNNIYAFPIYVKKDTSKPLLPNLSIAGKNIFPIDPPVTDEKDSARFVIVYGNTGAFINDSVTIAVRQFYQGSQVAAWTLRRKYPAETDTIVLTVPILKRAGEHQLQVELDPVGLIVESSESDNMANAFFTVVTTDFKVLQPTAFTTGSYATMIFLNPTTALAASARMAELELDTLDTFATAKKSVIPMQEFTTSYDISQLPKPGRYFWRIRQQNSGRGWSTGSFYLGASATYAIGQADEAAWSGNSFMHASYAAGSGAQIADTRLAVRAVSAGFSDGRTGSIDINGVNVLAPVFGTGHNLVVIDTSSMSLSQRRRFDPSNVPEESDSLSKFIASIPFGAIVADVVVDEGSNNLTQSARDALKTIGSASIDRLARRDSWAIIGRKGASAGSVPESYVPQFGGPASAETTFIRKEYAASISTQSFGPLASLSAFSMTGSIPAGSSVETRFIGTRFNNRIDTLLLTSGTALASTNLANTERYKEGRIVFSLQTSGASTPSILRWNLAAKAFTELAVSPQRTSVSPQSVMEGEPVTFTGTIFNVSATPAESVTVQLAMNEGGLATVLRSQKIPVIAGNDSSVFSYRYETKGKRGTHAFTMTVDPMDSLLEQSKSNNTVSASFTIQSDTVRPQLIVAVDGQRVFDGDYVRQHPEINVRYTDNNPTAITAADTANFKIRLNNYPVYFAPGVAELVPSTSPGEAQLKWTPELPNGENFIQIYALDISGNSSDTTTLFVNVSSEFTLKDVYNLPNPFAGRTNFTFNILSPVNPDEVTIRIFTVAGRLIQTFSYPCRIGFNSFSWDGRDKDGDEIANGVYFYKVTVKQSDKQTDTISKLVKMK